MQSHITSSLPLDLSGSRPGIIPAAINHRSFWLRLALAGTGLRGANVTVPRQHCCLSNTMLVEATRSLPPRWAAASLLLLPAPLGGGCLVLPALAQHLVQLLLLFLRSQTHVVKDACKSPWQSATCPSRHPESVSQFLHILPIMSTFPKLLVPSCRHGLGYAMTCICQLQGASACGCCSWLSDRYKKHGLALRFTVSATSV